MVPLNPANEVQKLILDKGLVLYDVSDVRGICIHCVLNGKASCLSERYRACATFICRNGGYSESDYCIQNPNNIPLEPIIEEIKTIVSISEMHA